MSENQPNGSVGDFLGAAGEPPVITWKGKSYKVAPGGLPTVLDRLEKLVVQKATENVRSLRDSLDPKAWQEVWNDLMDDIKARHFRAGGKLFQSTLNSPQFGHLFLTALLREYQEDITEVDVLAMTHDEPEQVEAVVLLVSPDFYRRVFVSLGAAPAQIELAMVEVLEELVRATRSRTKASPSIPA